MGSGPVVAFALGISEVIPRETRDVSNMMVKQMRGYPKRNMESNRGYPRCKPR